MVSSLWVGLCPGEGKGVTRGGLDAGVGLLQHVWVKPRLAGGQGPSLPAEDDSDSEPCRWPA